MQVTEKQITARIRARGRGFVFTTKQFMMDSGNSGTVRTALTRLVQKGTIRRLGHGLYDFPVVHPKLGLLAPRVERVIEAIKKVEAIEVQPTGAYAANLLGLSTQVPMKIQLYTNGPKKTINFGRQVLVLKPTTPKNMVGAGTKAGLILHALRYIGKDDVTPEMVERLKIQCSPSDLKALKAQARFAPMWIGRIFNELIDHLRA